MNPELNNTENTEVVKEKHPVFQVTKTSKYLAMLLFILMPFIGGWIGYMYAPEKVVEVERVVEGDIIAKQTSVLDKKKIFKEVLNAPNGFDPFVPLIVDGRKNEVEVGNFNLVSRTEGNLVTTVTLLESDVVTKVSGNFELLTNFHDGEIQLTFTPNEQSTRELPWPSTQPESTRTYVVSVDTEQNFIDDLCDSSCAERMFNPTNPKKLSYIGEAKVRSVTYQVENIGVGAVPYRIDLYDLELTSVENE